MDLIFVQERSGLRETGSFLLPVHFCQKVEGDQHGDPLG